MSIRLKRIYDDAEPSDGYRVLVDRLWPRGVSKSRAAIDWWAKEVAPSSGLRGWYGHDGGRWREFRRRYREELASKGERVAELLRQAEHGTVTLVFAAKDVEHSNALVLKEFMEAGPEPKGEADESTS